MKEGYKLNTVKAHKTRHKIKRKGKTYDVYEDSRHRHYAVKRESPFIVKLLKFLLKLLLVLIVLAVIAKIFS